VLAVFQLNTEGFLALKNNFDEIETHAATVSWGWTLTQAGGVLSHPCSATADGEDGPPKSHGC
jgi:hypothetical protein